MLARRWWRLHHDADVITRDPKRGAGTFGMYRIMQTGKNTLAMQLGSATRLGAAHWRDMAERGERMHVCIASRRSRVDVFGQRAAAADDRRFLFAGFLRKRPSHWPRRSPAT